MRPIVITRQLDTDDANGIALAQQTAGAGNLVLAGALASGGVATLDTQRKVGIASAGDLSAITFTVYGTDGQNQVISESLVGPNNNTVSTILDFLTVTRVAVSAAVGTDVTVGTTGVGASFPIPLDLYLNPVNVQIKVSISGTANGTVQYTNDPIFTMPLEDVEWTDDTDLDNLSSGYTTGTLISPCTAVRLVTNSGDGTITMVVTQSGATG